MTRREDRDDYDIRQPFLACLFVLTGIGAVLALLLLVITQWS